MSLEGTTPWKCSKAYSHPHTSEVNLETIIAGIDVLFVGPFDLGNSIGHPIIDGTMHNELKEAITKIQRVAKENKKSSGIYSMSGDQARDFADQGFNMVSP